MMFTLLPLDTLPPVPEHFIARAKGLVRQKADLENRNVELLREYGFADREVRLLDGTMTKSRIGEAYAMGDDWENWVRENITPDFIETGVRTTGGYEESTVHAPHVDVSTPEHPYKWKFFYLVEEGGDNVVTTWYTEKGHPTVRLDSTSDHIVHVDDYSRLNTIESIRIPTNQWMLFDTRVMHGVENITGIRTILVVSVDPELVTFEIKPNLSKG